MPLSRYRKCKLIDNKKISIPVWSFIYQDSDVYDYQVGVGDRFDKLAKKDFGDEKYWWILARINSISFFFDLHEGMTIKRPRNSLLFLNQV